MYCVYCCIISCVLIEVTCGRYANGVVKGSLRSPSDEHEDMNTLHHYHVMKYGVYRFFRTVQCIEICGRYADGVAKGSLRSPCDKHEDMNKLHHHHVMKYAVYRISRVVQYTESGICSLDLPLYF